MAENPSNQDVFDVRRIRRLVALMREHDLAEVDIRQGDTRIQMRRAGVSVISPGPAAIAYPAPLPPAAPQPEASPRPATTESAAPGLMIKSPMVGTFYAAPDPESPPYVKVGDHVGPDTTVCIIEAMKVFNQIPAEVTGKITAMLVENGMPVEFGQPLFRVERV
ncbi:MAG: acetyl-CoA carboxylase biotin carboxyl carrier protein [Planctomycetota bacterium]